MSLKLKNTASEVSPAQAEEYTKVKQISIAGDHAKITCIMYFLKKNSYIM